MKNGMLTKLEKYWIMYDVGNSAFSLICTTLIPIYFKNMATEAGMALSDSTAAISYAISISTIIMVILGPIIGTIADNKGRKKPLFLFFVMMGVIACAGLAVPKIWVVFLAIYVIARIGFSGSLIFYDSMLVDITEKDRMDEVSSHGYAWGYLGSVVPFVFSLLLVLGSDKIGISATLAMMIAFVVNALWWGCVTIPLLKNYTQIHYVENSEHMIRDSFTRLSGIFSELKNNKPVTLFLIAFFLYIDGVYTIIDMATSYGKDVGLDDTSMLLALLLTQVVAFPCSILFGKLSRRFEARKLILVCVVAYFGVTVFALQLDTAFEFWFLASFVGVFQGAIQALSRSYYAKMIPEKKSSEYFGVYDIFGKGAAFVGTMLMGATTQIFGTSKAGVGSISLLFIAGFIVFLLQNKAAREQ